MFRLQPFLIYLIIDKKKKGCIRDHVKCWLRWSYNDKIPTLWKTNNTPTKSQLIPRGQYHLGNTNEMSGGRKTYSHTCTHFMSSQILTQVDLYVYKITYVLKHIKDLWWERISMKLLLASQFHSLNFAFQNQR